METRYYLRLDEGKRLLRLDMIESIVQAQSGGSIIGLESGTSHVVSESVDEVVLKVEKALDVINDLPRQNVTQNLQFLAGGSGGQGGASTFSHLMSKVAPNTARLGDVNPT